MLLKLVDSMAKVEETSNAEPHYYAMHSAVEQLLGTTHCAVLCPNNYSRLWGNADKQ